MLIVVAIVIALLCAAPTVGAFIYFKRKVSVSVGAEREALITQINESTKTLEELLSFKDSYASKGQFDSLVALKDAASKELEKEKNSLRDIETRLETAQKMVEEKELSQQEIKSAKEEHGIKLDALLGRFGDISKGAIALEQQVAASLKVLDQATNIPDINEDQKGALIDLQTAMTAAGGNLRDLIVEYESLIERLNLLKQQHDDLEEEYTKLVEQQLGD